MATQVDLKLHRKLLFLGALLLLLLKDTAAIGKLVKPRPPDLVPTRILQYGCLPFVDFQCPPQMECLVDLNYPYYGQCFCKSTFSKRFKPPHDTGSELYHPGRQDCVNYGSINILTAIIHAIYVIVGAKLTITCALTMYRVWKHGGLKPNATSLAMALLTLACSFYTVLMIDYMLNRAGWDRQYKVHDRTYNQTNVGMNVTNTWFCVECICTWFDLWKRSTSMSKKTSVGVIFIRWLFRLYGMTISVIYALNVFGLLKAARGKNLLATIMAANCWTMAAATAVFGILIRRVLCKNMKDVTNPNWKAADAIQTTAWISVCCWVLYQCCMKMIPVYLLYASGPMQISDIIVTVANFIPFTHFKNWFDYLLYCQRRYLESYDTDRMSNYFGFSTIQRKQSSAMMSSVASSMQMMSSAPSTVEANQEKNSVA